MNAKIARKVKLFVFILVVLFTPLSYARAVKILGILLPIFLVLTMPTSAHAARLWSSGLELQSIAAGEYEWIAGGSGTGSISTSVFRSGLASVRLNSSNSYQYVYHEFTASSAESFYARFYIYIAATPIATSQIAYFDTASTEESAIGIGTDMKLILYDDGVVSVLGTATNALSTNTWYRIEWNYDSGGNSEVRVDGVQVLLSASHAGDNITNFVLCACGVNFSNNTNDFYFDDVAINDTSGSVQNSWPGAGSIVHMQPDGAGDNSGCGAGTYADVDEVTPDDATTICTLTTDGGGDILDVNEESSSSAGIDSYDTVTLVQVGVREAATSAAGESWQARLKSASGGTVTSSATTAHDDTTYTTNGDTAPRNYTLTSYTDPTTAVAWTPTGTNSLDNMQVGITSIDGNPDIIVSTLWALVEYIDGAPGSGSPARVIRLLGRLNLLNGRLHIW